MCIAYTHARHATPYTDAISLPIYDTSSRKCIRFKLDFAKRPSAKSKYIRTLFIVPVRSHVRCVLATLVSVVLCGIY